MKKRCEAIGSDFVFCFLVSFRWGRANRDTHITWESIGVRLASLPVATGFQPVEPASLWSQRFSVDTSLRTTGATTLAAGCGAHAAGVAVTRRKVSIIRVAGPMVGQERVPRPVRTSGHSRPENAAMRLGRSVESQKKGHGMSLRRHAMTSILKRVRSIAFPLIPVCYTLDIGSRGGASRADFGDSTNFPGGDYLPGSADCPGFDSGARGQFRGQQQAARRQQPVVRIRGQRFPWRPVLQGIGGCRRRQCRDGLGSLRRFLRFAFARRRAA